MKVTRKELAAVLHIGEDDDPGVLTLSKGVFTYRSEYFYRPKMTPQQLGEYKKHIIEGNSNYTVKIIDTGDHWAPFRGGEGIRRNSYYWVQMRVDKPAKS